MYDYVAEAFDFFTFLSVEIGMPRPVDSLPKFESPPVVETVLGLFFQASQEFSVVHQGILWDRHFRSTFPILEYRAPLEEEIERFGVGTDIPASAVQWQVFRSPPQPRLWAKSDSQEHVLQLQANAILNNWLRKPHQDYIDYSQRRNTLLGQVDLIAVQIGELKPTQAIVTYINHIEIPDGDSYSSVLQRALAVWTNVPYSNNASAPDNAVLQFSYPIEETRGRLHVKVNRARRTDDRRSVLQLELNARVALTDRTSLHACLDLAHETVIVGFASITTPVMHECWKRTR